MSKSTNRYQEIILESAHLFRQKGYLATSIRDISDALSITSAALYYHFKSKEEILLEIMRLSLQQLREAVHEAIAHEGDAWQKIGLALRAHLRISLEYQDFAIVLLMDLRHLAPEYRPQIIAERDAYEDMWEEMLAECQQKELIRPDVNLPLLRLLTFGALNLVVTWYKPSGPYTPENIADAFWQYISQGVLMGQPFSPEQLTQTISPSV